MTFFFATSGFSEVFADHLNFDAVVAFADGEMSMVAYQRAAAHVARCETCAAEVAEQTAARDLLRSACAPKMPGSLFDQLRSIPVALPAEPRDGTPLPTDRRPRFGWR
jgi:anti-sigma factor RsiW